MSGSPGLPTGRAELVLPQALRPYGVLLEIGRAEEGLGLRGKLGETTLKPGGYSNCKRPRE